MQKNIILLLCLAFSVFISSCGSNNTTEKPKEAASAPAPEKDKGIGKFTNVVLSHPLDTVLATKGKLQFDIKCMACHKLTSEKLVGPGWKGVTDRRTPEYIMNFTTNTDEMLNKDPNAKALLEVCMVRMPNQNLTDDEARQVLEFMRQNDGKN
jgi:cytochrome c551/c552